MNVDNENKINTTIQINQNINSVEAEKKIEDNKIIHYEGVQVNSLENQKSSCEREIAKTQEIEKVEENGINQQKE